jgi:glycosyltransferase involved in cell wall biosynthesis
MTIDQIIAPLMLVGAVAGSLVIAAIVAGATLYDIRETRRRRDSRLHPNARRNKRRPLITVIIPTDNDERRIEACLGSVLKNTYRKVEILVVDNASGDATKRIVKQCIVNNPKKPIKLIARRKPVCDNTALSEAYRKHGSGEYTMILDPAKQLARHALREAALRVGTDGRIGALTPSQVLVSELSVAGLFQKYQAFLSQRARKFASVSGLERANHTGTVYRRDIFLREFKRTARGFKLKPGELPGSAALSGQYAADFVVYIPAQSSFYRHFIRRYCLIRQQGRGFASQLHRCLSPSPNARRLSDCVRLLYTACIGILGVATPILLSYFAYLAFRLHEPTLLLLCGAALSMILLFAIWDAEQLDYKQKLAYSLGLPVTYALFYAESVVRLLIIPGIVVPEKLKLQREIDSTLEVFL